MQGENFQNLGYTGGLKIMPHNKTPVAGDSFWEAVLHIVHIA